MRLILTGIAIAMLTAGPASAAPVLLGDADMWTVTTKDGTDACNKAGGKITTVAGKKGCFAEKAPNGKLTRDNLGRIIFVGATVKL